MTQVIQQDVSFDRDYDALLRYSRGESDHGFSNEALGRLLTTLAEGQGDDYSKLDGTRLSNEVHQTLISKFEDPNYLSSPDLLKYVARAFAGNYEKESKVTPTRVSELKTNAPIEIKKVPIRVAGIEIDLEIKKFVGPPPGSNNEKVLELEHHYSSLTQIPLDESIQQPLREHFSEKLQNMLRVKNDLPPMRDGDLGMVLDYRPSGRSVAYMVHYRAESGFNFVQAYSFSGSKVETGFEKDSGTTPTGSFGVMFGYDQHFVDNGLGNDIPRLGPEESFDPNTPTSMSTARGTFSGGDKNNRNTASRAVAIHGTPFEEKRIWEGKNNSAGCLTFSNLDMAAIAKYMGLVRDSQSKRTNPVFRVEITES